MIHTFGDDETERLFGGERVKRFERFVRIARRKLEMIHAAARLHDLKIPPGNRLEELKVGRAGWWSIRINDQWRVCFIWREGGAYEVRIEDYH